MISFMFISSGNNFHKLILVVLVMMQVAEYGSVQVEKLMNIERYSHVMHISSTVRILA